MTVEIDSTRAALILLQETFKAHSENNAKLLHGRSWKDWYYQESYLLERTILLNSQKSKLLTDAVERALFSDIDPTLLPVETRQLLTADEAAAIRMRFGFIDGKIHSLSEIADIKTWSKSRSRRLIQKGVEKIRRPLEIAYIENFALDR